MDSTAVARSAQSPRGRLHGLQVLGLFPELLGVGGVQEAGRLTATALSAVIQAQGGNAQYLALNDSSGTHTLEQNGCSISLRGSGRAKARFVLEGISRAHPLKRAQAGLIVAAHPHLALPAVIMRQFAPNLKLIVMAHGVEVWQPLPLARRRALLRADLVLAPSRYTAEQLRQVQSIPPERIRVLPWPLSADFLRLAAAPDDLPLPSDFPDGRVVLTVGRWAASERYKGADELIRFLAQARSSSPDLHLVAVGGGDDLPRLVGLARSLELADRVHFLLGLSREQIAACYSRADIFALPSTGEGFGLVFLEAMAFGKPLVGTAFGGTVDVVEDRVNGLLVPPHDAHRLSAALSELIRDEQLRNKLGQAGAQIVRTKYSFDVFCDGLRRVLDECMSQGMEHS